MHATIFKDNPQLQAEMLMKNTELKKLQDIFRVAEAS
jgi:hypothetical protein